MRPTGSPFFRIGRRLGRSGALLAVVSLAGAAASAQPAALPAPGCDAFAYVLGAHAGSHPAGTIAAAVDASDVYSGPLRTVNLLRVPGGRYMDLVTRGSLLAAAVVVPGGGGVDLLDLSDPASPTLVGQIRVPYPVWDLSLFEQGGTTFVAFGDEAVPNPVVGAQIWAILPSGPIFVSQPSHGGLSENVHHVFVEERGTQRFLYVSATTGAFAAVQAHLDIYDVTDPASPVFLTALQGYQSPTGPVVFFTHDFTVFSSPTLGQNLLAIGAVDHGLLLFRVDDPAAPVFLDQYANYGPSVDGHSMALSKSAQFLYLTNEVPTPLWGGLNVFDISGAGGGGGIVEVAQYDPPTGFVHYARRLGRFLFTADASAGLAIFDVSDPGSLEMVDARATNFGTGVPFCWEALPFVGEDGTYLLANDLGEGLWIHAFEPFTARRTGPSSVPNAQALQIATQNRLSVPTKVRVVVRILRAGVVLFAGAANVNVAPNAETSIPLPSSIQLPKGLYDLSLEVLQLEAGTAVYRYRADDKFRID